MSPNPPIKEEHIAFSAQANLDTIRFLSQQIRRLEKAIQKTVKLPLRLTNVGTANEGLAGRGKQLRQRRREQAPRVVQLMPGKLSDCGVPGTKENIKDRT